MNEILFETNYKSFSEQVFKIKIYDPGYYSPYTTLMIRIYDLNKGGVNDIASFHIKHNNMAWQDMFNPINLSEDYPIYPIELKYYIERIIKLQAFI